MCGADKMPVIGKFFGADFKKSPTARFSGFNLVEITVAISLVAIGFAGVVSLFPEAIRSTKAAIGDNYSSYVSNQFLVHIARSCNDPTKRFDSNSKDFWEAYVSAASGAIPETIPSEADENSAVFSSTPVENGIYSSDNPGLYRVTQGSTEFQDFHCTIRIWKSTVQNLYIYGTAFAEIDYDFAVKLNVEISFPAEKPYSKREKKYYSMEIFRQQL